MTELEAPVEALLESVVSPIERAGFGDRFFAAFVDGIILNLSLRAVTFLLIPILFKNTFNAQLINMFISILAIIIYYAILPYYHNGQTVGKKWNNIKVVDMAGNNLTMGHFIVREFVGRGIAVFNYLWYLTYLLALRKDRRALHDMIARTQVIKVM